MRRLSASVYDAFHYYCANAPRYAAVATLSTLAAGLYFRFREDESELHDDMTAALSVMVITFEDKPNGKKRCRVRGLFERPVHHIYAGLMLRRALSTYSTQMLPTDVFVPIPCSDGNSKVRRFLHPIVANLNEIFAVPTMLAICNSVPVAERRFYMALTMTGRRAEGDTFGHLVEWLLGIKGGIPFADEPPPRSLPLEDVTPSGPGDDAPKEGECRRSQPRRPRVEGDTNTAVDPLSHLEDGHLILEPLQDRRRSLVSRFLPPRKEDLAKSIPLKYRAYLVAEDVLEDLPPMDALEWDPGKVTQQRTAYDIACRMKRLGGSANHGLLWGPIDVVMPRIA
mmetsp:Transcript_133207/g.231009  ORF Transcript_133207/g.231009 Transcript_133207/m.231009 type:complete len:339 (-) Transcript_133207:258-1274(-)